MKRGVLGEKFSETIYLAITPIQGVGYRISFGINNNNDESTISDDT